MTTMTSPIRSNPDHIYIEFERPAVSEIQASPIYRVESLPAAAAREIAAAEGDKGPLQPHHVHAAYQRLDRQGVIPGQKRKQRPLRH